MRNPFLFLVSFFIVPLLCTAEQKGDAVKEEMQKLQGVWQVTKFTDLSGRSGTAEELKEFTFEFQGDQLTMRKDKDDPGRKLKYTLDPSKMPKWIDIDVMKGLPNGEAIYKMEGDELTICVVAATDSEKPTPRPSEFKFKKDQHSLFVLKKVKK